MKHRLYMAVTADEYELPIVVAGSPLELAGLIGKAKSTISPAICKKMVLRVFGERARIVRVGCEEEEADGKEGGNVYGAD